MEVRITGSTLTELPLEAVPNAITVFTRDDIRQLPVSTLEELLNLVPEVQALRSTDLAGTSMISIRGRRISYSSRELLLLLNGMRVDNPHFGGFSSTYPALPLANVERVEIIRGPGSAIYGSNAFTGVINVVTSTDATSVKMEVGSHERFEASAQYAAASDDNALHSSLFVSGTDFAGESLPVEDVFDEGTDEMRDPYRQYSLQWQLQYQEDSRLQLILSHFQADGSYAGGVADDFNLNEPRYVALMFEQAVHWHDDIDSRAQVGLQDWLLRSDVRPFTGFPVGSISTPQSSEPLYFKSEVHTREYWIRWQNDWELSNRNSVQFGLEYRNPRNERVRAASNYDLLALSNGQLPIAYYGNFDHAISLGEVASMDIVGVYAQHQAHWSDHIESVAGLRYDSYGSIGDNVSPRLGLIYHFDSSDTVKFLLSQAFRAPQFDERFAMNNPVILGNEDLKPETVNTAELIWLHSWQMAWLSLNLFTNRFHDAIVLMPAGNTGTRIYENSDSVGQSEGMSAELNSQVMQDLKVRIAATHFFDIPDSSFREATDLLTASAIYSFEPWLLSFTVNLNGERENLADSSGTMETLDAYALSHLKLIYSFATEKGQWQPYFEVRNLFDEAYTTPANTDFNPGGVANHGRELRLGFLVDF
ncbi:MAG TPA: TonB-dependent receptor [Dongiaceae bacterium]|nr:TonB-dependent receptor [Dongiaceae bacterium]